jgi:hypothetical protein
MTEEEKAEVDAMSRLELARKYRFDESGFWSTPQGHYAHERFWHVLGGFNPEISKKIGWGEPVDHD